MSPFNFLIQKLAVDHLNLERRAQLQRTPHLFLLMVGNNEKFEEQTKKIGDITEILTPSRCMFN